MPVPTIQPGEIVKNRQGYRAVILHHNQTPTSLGGRWEPIRYTVSVDAYDSQSFYRAERYWDGSWNELWTLDPNAYKAPSYALPSDRQGEWREFLQARIDELNEKVVAILGEKKEVDSWARR